MNQMRTKKTESTAKYKNETDAMTEDLSSLLERVERHAKIKIVFPIIQKQTIIICTTHTAHIRLIAGCHRIHPFACFGFSSGF